MAIAGKVAPTYAGEWSDILQYQQHVYVRYNGDCYISIKPSVGISPTNDEYWFLALKNVTQEQYDALVNGTTTVGNASKLGGLSAEEFVSNENLLINSDFRNPINTQGLTEYSGSNVKTIDKWVTGSAPNNKVIINEGYVSIGSNSTDSYKDLFQFVDNYEKYIGKTLTLSAKIRPTTKGQIGILDKFGIESKKYIFEASSDWVVVSVTNTMKEDSDVLRLAISVVAGYSGYIDIEWVKLELGSLATPFTPPNPLIEAVKCGVANADTVDGKHASDFLPLAGGALSGGLTVPTLNIKRYNNGYSAIYKNNSDTIDYGTLFRDYDADGNSMSLVLRGGNQIAATIDKDGNMYSILTANNVGSYALPITGGDLKGALNIFGNSDTSLPFTEMLTENGGTSYLINIDVSNGVRRQIAVGPILHLPDKRYALRFETSESGGWESFIIHHDGNSSKVVQATSAPSDTTAVWVDTANKVSKICKDGAWTALA